MFAVQDLWSRSRCGGACSVEVDGVVRTLAEPTTVGDGDACGALASTAVAYSWRQREQDGYGIVSLSLRNDGNAPVRIGDIVLFTHREDGEGEDAATRLAQRCIFGFADTLAYNYVSRVVSDRHGASHRTLPMGLIYNLPARKTFFAAQLTFERNTVVFNSKFAPEDGSLVCLECLVCNEGHILEPGEEITTDEVALRLSNDGGPYAELCRWADAVHAIYRPELPEHGFVGLTGGTMISTKAETMSEKIRRQLTMAPSLRKLGLDYFWISIANLKDGLPGNWLVPNDTNFPDGVRTILGEIMAAGLKPGFWINPFYLAEGSKDFDRMLPYVIHGADGQPAMRGTWHWGRRREDGTLAPLYALDPACPESLEYVGEVFRQYAEWGLRYYMLDFLASGLYAGEEQRHGFGAEHHRRFLRSLHRYQAPGTHRLIATGASLKLIGVASSSRIGLDYCEGRPLEPQFKSYPANYVINGSFGSSGAPNRNAVNNLAMWAFAHGRFFNCNSNMLTIDKPIPLSEARLAVTLFGISPSPVFLGDDLARMSPERLAMLKMVMPRAKTMPQPVDLFTKTDVDDDFVRIFVATIVKPWATWRVAAVFNLNDDFREVELPAELLGLAPDASYRMYDFWEETYRGIYQGSRRVQVAGNSAAVLRLEELRPHPWILSTDMHLLQGEAELDEVSWNPETMTLQGRMTRAAGERGNLFVIAPDGFRERHFNRGLVVAKSALDDSLVIRKRIHFQQDVETWSLEFDRWK
ncbi:MAG: hypothetical protein GX574_02120 [Lentisphaerae bacterium]|nr:hypothetical protein [Lentisphaerota bacterium]